jgi:predicted 3-demethylubiquinone-9 3-methyltransferase (glyoxalase superfamily)
MNHNSQKIIPHLWFDDHAEEAAKFYTSIFGNSRIGDITRYSKEGFEIHRQPEGKVMTVEFELAGYKFIGLNAGPLFEFTPAISFFVTCETEAEVDNLWRKLTEGGSVLMELNKYDWSDKYGWVKDKFGLTWQISLGKLEDVGQKITPSLMYVSEKGRAEEALNLYTSVFGNSDIVGILHYGPNQDQPEGSVMHAQFRLNGEVFMAMDSSPKFADFTFNEAISLLISCASQEEVDYFWEKLSDGGEEGPCGWLKDRFGVSWQVHPAVLSEMIKDPDTKKVERVTKAFLRMKKFDIEALEQAYEGKQTAA